MGVLNFFFVYIKIKHNLTKKYVRYPNFEFKRNVSEKKYVVASWPLLLRVSRLVLNAGSFLFLNVTFSRHLEQNFYQCVKTIENKVLQIQFDLNKTKIMPKFSLAIFDKNKIYDSKLQ